MSDVTDGWRLGYRPGLDQLRAIAVSLVVIQHCFLRGRVGWAGGVGVTIFFVLSGFLITRLLLEEREHHGTVNLRHFYVRRARRLLPALPLVFILCAAVNASLGLPIAEPLLGSALYVANYLSIGDPAWGSFGHMWSLAVEEHFYVVWPVLVAKLPRRMLLRFAVTLAALVAVARWHVAQTNGSMAYRGTHLRIDAMLIGAVLALLVSHVPAPSLALVLFSIGVLARGLPWSSAGSAVQWGVLPLALASAVLVHHAATAKRTVPALVHVGRISYGIYLFHLPIVMVLRTAGLDGFPLLLVAMPVTLALAELSHRLIEAPMRRVRSSAAAFPTA